MRRDESGALSSVRSAEIEKMTEQSRRGCGRRREIAEERIRRWAGGKADSRTSLGKASRSR